MNKTLKIIVNAGQETCASEPGQFCRFVTVKNFNTFSCHLFEKRLEDKAGWLQRLPECLKAEELP